MAYTPIDWEKSLLRECKRRRLSPRTYETYHKYIEKFLDLTKKELGKISKKDVRKYLEHLSERNLAGSTLNVAHMALRFLFEEVLEKRIWIDIKYSKVPKKLPLVLTKEEVKRLLESINNKKHKLMITLLYSAGLRVSELLNLKVKDLEIEKGYGYVRNGKGGKDRLFIISEKLREDINELIISERSSNESLLFKNNREKNYSSRTIQQIVKKAARKAGIKKEVHPHTLRHSFATHLIDNNSSLNEVQTLLGHKSPETTMTYVHSNTKNMINLKSPLDTL